MHAITHQDDQSPIKSVAPKTAAALPPKGVDIEVFRNRGEYVVRFPHYSATRVGPAKIAKHIFAAVMILGGVPAFGLKLYVFPDTNAFLIWIIMAVLSFAGLAVSLLYQSRRGRGANELRVSGDTLIRRDLRMFSRRTAGYFFSRPQKQSKPSDNNTSMSYAVYVRYGRQDLEITPAYLSKEVAEKVVELLEQWRHEPSVIKDKSWGVYGKKTLLDA